MSDELKLLLNAIISNQEQARAKQEAFEHEFLMFRKENTRRFDDVDIELRGIRRHIDITEKELDRTIHRLEKIDS